jgi:mannosyltransferase
MIIQTNSLATGTIPKKKSAATTLFITIFFFILIIGVVALSQLVLSKQSIRLDESQSLWQSSHSPAGVIDVISHDVHVPLYGLLLHFWEFLLGTDVARARLMSLIFFIASIPASYALARTIYNRSTALFTALLIATSPFLNWYGNEIRMYSLLTLITIGSQFFFLKLFTSQKKTEQFMILIWFGYAVTSLIGIYTHYFFWLVLVTQAIFFFWHKDTFPKNSFRNLIIIALLLIVAISPWLWYVKSQHSGASPAPQLIKPGTVDLFNTFSQFLFGFQDDHINTIITSLWPLSVLFGFLSIRKQNKIPIGAQYFLLSALLPIGIAFIISIVYRPVFLSRYLILTAPALYIFIAWFLSSYPPKFSAIIKVIFIFIMVFTLFQQTISATTPVKENYKQASKYITTSARPEDIIILSAPFTAYPFEYYYNGPTNITTMPYWNPYTTGAIPPFSENEMINQVNAIKADHNRAWVLLSYNQGYQENIYNYFETHFQRIDHQSFSPGLDLYVYQLRYSQ